LIINLSDDVHVLVYVFLRITINADCEHLWVETNSECLFRALITLVRVLSVGLWPHLLYVNLSYWAGHSNRTRFRWSTSVMSEDITCIANLPTLRNKLDCHSSATFLVNDSTTRLVSL